MTSFPIRFIAVFALAVTGISAFRGKPDHSSSLVTTLAADAMDGHFHRFSLLEAAIIAGGITETEQVASVTRLFRQKAKADSDVRNRNESYMARSTSIFDSLHERILTGEYQSDYSQLHRTLENGNYNCVTATVLYRCLCQQEGLEIQVVAGKDHVLCRTMDDPRCYIETTCKEWHRLDDAQKYRRLSDSLKVDELRGLNDVQLVGKVFYNRGVEALEDGQFSAAASLLQLACEFDPQDTAAQENLLATLNNWALAECDAGHYEVASRLINRLSSIDSTYPPLKTNDLHIHQKWIKSLCESKDYSRALVVMDQVLERRPDADSFRSGRRMIEALAKGP